MIPSMMNPRVRMKAAASRMVGFLTGQPKRCGVARPYKVATATANVTERESAIATDWSSAIARCNHATSSEIDCEELLLGQAGSDGASSWATNPTREEATVRFPYHLAQIAALIAQNKLARVDRKAVSSKDTSCPVGG